MKKNNDKYQSYFLGRLGNWLSQGGHTLSWGASDVSISAKTDYMASRGSKTWKVYKSIIDFAFRPIDGDKHTQKAYQSDMNENYEIGIGVYQTVMCGIFILIFCPLIASIVYPISWIAKIFKK